MRVALAMLFLIVGALAGGLHFVLLRRNADLFVRGGSVLSAIGLQFGRMGVTIALLVAAALCGWPSLLTCAAGVLLARQVVVHRLGRVELGRVAL